MEVVCCRVLGPEGSRPLNRLVLLQSGAAVLQGVAFALLVPVLKALLGTDPGDVWPWLAAFTGCVLAYAALQGAAVSGGFTVGSQLSRVLHRRMADQALRLPLGWFTAGRTAEFSRLAGQNVIQVTSTPAHLLRPFLTSVLTPVTLVVATFFFDVSTALVLLACVPVLFAVQQASTALMRRLALGRDAAIGESADRVLEYTRNQPVLRAFGRTAEGYGALDDALAAEARSDRRLIVRGLPGLVSFTFATRLVFALLRARLPERGMTALVGPSGAGKTTVAALIARFRDATEGAVRVGGVDVREIAADDLAAHVSLVFQDVYLFDGTIEENVRIAAPDAGPQELAEAAALSGLDRVIEELPDGWDTKVGEGGARLSGGQRQRVSIARALLKDAPILVLDEATAALDQEYEALFAEAVRTLAERKTLLVIAHRLSTVVHADQILLLEDGEITERGTHDELVTAGGTYASFWERRSRAHGWRLEAARS
ncbi:ABC transporter ATP-binding protein [Streptomyces sp. GMY01]|uniref:ABC transporter ATP-binding protein n=1 Tax=Streptomyces sp. GMY02 TaxID=1333528 RepID=UPI00146F2A2B|nr:ABC transporter ATP-binding protein [Streptomyces sp. GMY02]NMO34592.1 ABC transporter ATP-binding protein [Streptomyces sp. GMY02]